MCPSWCLQVNFYLFLYVLQQEGRGSQIVHWNVEKALNLLLMEIHGDQVGETCTNTRSGTLAVTNIALKSSLFATMNSHFVTSYFTEALSGYIRHSVERCYNLGRCTLTRTWCS